MFAQATLTAKGSDAVTNLLSARGRIGLVQQPGRLSHSPAFFQTRSLRTKVRQKRDFM